MNLKWRLQQGQLFMLRPDLDEISVMTLSLGYFETKNTDDMIPDWLALLNTVFGGYTIDKVSYFVDSPHWCSDRVKLIQKDGSLVALSVAWQEVPLWPKSGNVLWVAVLPKHQKRGLGLYLLSQTLRHFAKEGLRDAVVYTDESRLPAIKMYLNSGFIPLVTGTVSGEMERWKHTLTALGRSDLIATIRNDYARISMNE
jgi:mycothiol synthase